MNIAILIDAENVLPSHADLIFDHAQALGTVIFKEIYGAASALSAWVAPVLKYAIHPNLTIKAAKGKNSSDIALVIGAMDLLVAGSIDSVIIASSDSDFSALSVRLRNAGIDVIGMGTDKSNELWRTACTTFVQLETAPKAQPKAQPKPQPKAQPKAQAKPQQPQPEPKKPAKPAASTHQERVAVIEELIAKRLESQGGRAQVSTLFPVLNRLPEYRVDRQGAGKKPLNYLTSTFADVFQFESGPDGNSWVSLGGVSAAPESEAPLAETPAPEPADSEPEIELPAPEAEPEAAPEAVEAPVEAPAPSAPAGMAEKLIAGGLDAEAARSIADIFEENPNLRAAYNRLRSAFGNTTGREYYLRAKEILGAIE